MGEQNEGVLRRLHANQGLEKSVPWNYESSSQANMSETVNCVYHWFSDHESGKRFDLWSHYSRTKQETAPMPNRKLAWGLQDMYIEYSTVIKHDHVDSTALEYKGV